MSTLTASTLDRLAASADRLRRLKTQADDERELRNRLVVDAINGGGYSYRAVARAAKLAVSVIAGIVAENS